MTGAHGSDRSGASTPRGPPTFEAPPLATRLFARFAGALAAVVVVFASLAFPSVAAAPALAFALRAITSRPDHGGFARRRGPPLLAYVAAWALAEYAAASLPEAVLRKVVVVGGGGGGGDARGDFFFFGDRGVVFIRRARVFGSGAAAGAASLEDAATAYGLLATLAAVAVATRAARRCPTEDELEEALVAATGEGFPRDFARFDAPRRRFPFPSGAGAGGGSPPPGGDGDAEIVETFLSEDEEEVNAPLLRREAEEAIIVGEGGRAGGTRRGDEGDGIERRAEEGTKEGSEAGDSAAAAAAAAAFASSRVAARASSARAASDARAFSARVTPGGLPAGGWERPALAALTDLLVPLALWIVALSADDLLHAALLLAFLLSLVWPGNKTVLANTGRVIAVGLALTYAFALILPRGVEEEGDGDDPAWKAALRLVGVWRPDRARVLVPLACVLVINCVVVNLPDVVHALRPRGGGGHDEEEDGGARRRAEEGGGARGWRTVWTRKTR